MNTQQQSVIQRVLDQALAKASSNNEGSPAGYIPELANVPLNITAASILLCEGSSFVSGDHGAVFTLQSVAKLVVLIGLLETLGHERVFSWINAESTGRDFASVAHLAQHGPVPSNPMVNSGAIALCSHIPGNAVERLQWLRHWTTRLFNADLKINETVFASERRTGDTNRALAYLMRSHGVITGEAEDILETYFALCSFEANISQAVALPMVLANGGLKANGERVISQVTASTVTAIMATSGLYDETGRYLVRTGLPAKSGVSGLMVAVSTGRGGIAVYSPRVNPKGGSVRGHLILEYVSRELGLHFATPTDVSHIHPIDSHQ